MCFDNGYTPEKLAAITAVVDAFYDDQTHAEWAQLENYLPVTRSGYSVFAAGEASDAPWNDILESARFLPTGKDNWTRTQELISDMMQNAMKGADAQALLDALQEQLEAEGLT